MSNAPISDSPKAPRTDYVAMVLEADIPKPTMKHILLTIAALATEKGICRPSITRLAILTGLDRSTVKRNLKKLEQDNWLHIDRPETLEQNETNFYTLNPRKYQIYKVSLRGRGTEPLGNKIGAQNPYSRGTTPPNTTTTPAPRRTAAPQAQAGGRGAGSNVIKEEKENTGTRLLFPEHMHVETEPTKPLPFTRGPVKATTVPVASSNPYEGREYITQAEFDEAIKKGFGPFDLPEVRDEEDIGTVNLFP
jgi:hypothetical protein